MTDDAKPFARVAFYDDPTLVGAQWWHASMAIVDPIARRKALLGIAAVLATATLVGTCAAVSSDCGSDVDVTAKEALAAQRELGWSFGSEDVPLVFDAATGEPFDPSSLDLLATVLAPRTALYRPYYVPTLFQAVTARPTMVSVTVEDAGGAPRDLRSILRPIATPSMAVAEGRGRALSSLFDGAPPGRALVVDLPGPDAVAFAAGLADRFEPIFLFDNWPHPKGVVPAHLTLAATAHYAPYFVDQAARREGTPRPAFILDGNRLAPYNDEPDKFDNRYMARLPTAAKLRELGVTEVLYVRPSASSPELDDLNADFVDYQKSGIEVRYVDADAFQEAPADDDWASTVDGGLVTTPRALDADAGGRTLAQPSSQSQTRHYYYGGPRTHWFFWPHYGFGVAPRPAMAPAFSAPAYRVAPRTTIFSSGGPSRVRPSAFGSIGVVRSRSTGEVVGASSPSGRGGSWGRSGFFTGG